MKETVYLCLFMLACLPHCLFSSFLQAMLGHEDCVTALLEHKASVLCRDTQGRTPLHYAASRGHTEILACLVQAAVAEEPHKQLLDNKQYTPLHWAAYKGLTRINTVP